MSRLVVCLLVTMSGMAALSWEVLWQLKATLSLGISAAGAAITLAATMGGMSLGSWLAGYVLRGPAQWYPLLAYAALELAVGVSGLTLAPGFRQLEALDTWFYQVAPQISPLLHALGVALLLGPPTLAMGATIPVLGLIGRQFGLSLAGLYALNTAGAAAGCLGLTMLIPEIGVRASITLGASWNIAVALAAFLLGHARGPLAPPATGADPAPGQVQLPRPEQFIAWLTGFVTFSLEVAWFRALRAAFQTTTESFAIMLVPVLLALAVGARLALLRLPLGPVLVASGTAILIATPAVERMDTFISFTGTYWQVMGGWFLWALAILGPPMALLGTALPQLLQARPSPSAWARLYSLNTLGAIVGALLSSWLLLPTLGHVHTAWLCGLLVALVGLSQTSRARPVMAMLLLAGALVAWTCQSGIGTTRVPGLPADFGKNYKILAFLEGPDSQVAVVEQGGHGRYLLINSFPAAADVSQAHYMAWMGRVPMLLHPNPRKALVICFGTGQTINAVRQEGPDWADVVDVNPRVLQVAGLFPVNQGVLQDPRVHPTVMDGRAWLRRTTQQYDVVTLEPMPPNYAGVNALYCREFYELVKRRLAPGGVVAQWLPIHLVAPKHALAIAATFREAFPNSILWRDPLGDRTPILVGRVDGPPLGEQWPGLERTSPGRDLTPEQIRSGMELDGKAFALYAALGQPVTDDNQMLAYGRGMQLIAQYADVNGANVLLIHWARALATAQALDESLQASPDFPELREAVSKVRHELAGGALQTPGWAAVAQARDRKPPSGRVAELLGKLDRQLHP